VAGFTIEFTLIYNLLLLSAIIYYGSRVVKNKDLVGGC
jgi:hypothetical protein